MTDLLPCPFCGGNKVKCELEEDGPEEWYRVMECYDCGARGPRVADTQDDPCSAALGRWNRRAPVSYKLGMSFYTLSPDGLTIETPAPGDISAPSLFGWPIIESDDLLDVGEIVLG